MRAIPYVRWSTDKQSEGSSLDHQKATITDFVTAKGWTIAPPSEWIRDEGVSGYYGDNTADDGGLAVLIRGDGEFGLATVA